MRLTAFTDYSLRVLIYVAAQPARRATIGEIALSYGISEHHLTKVVHFLGKAGFLQNIRGHGGGLSLSRDAAGIDVATVVREAEGVPLPAACFDASAPRCSIAPACRLKDVLQEASDAFYATLARYTIADLVAEPALRTLLLVPMSSHAVTRRGRQARPGQGNDARLARTAE
jgi:Rrf2 family nitric oxide-sensitive transcriptional repressor